MKKLTALLLTASVILSLASCGGTESASTTTSGSTTTTTTATEGTTTPETTTTEETTTTPETTTSDAETTTTTEGTTTTTPETSTSTTTTKVTTTAPTTTTTKPVTTTKVTTTTAKPVITTTPKTEATTTTTAAPTYDHCEGFNKIWGKSSDAFCDTMNNYGERMFGLGSPYSQVFGWNCSGKSVNVYGMKLKNIYFEAYPDDYTDYDSSADPHYCRSLYMEVNETSDGVALTLENAEKMISALYGPSEKNVDDSGKVSYHWYGTADGDIKLSESGSYGAKLEIDIQESGWVLTWTP